MPEVQTVNIPVTPTGPTAPAPAPTPPAAPNPAPPTAQQPAPTPAPTPPPTPEPQKAPEPKPTLDLAKYSEEYKQTGKLSDDSYKELSEKFNIPKEVVDSYIAYQQRAQAAERADLLKDVGGEEGFAKLSNWAAASLTPADIEAYNKVASSGDPAQIKVALASLQAKYVAAFGAPPSLVNAAGQPAVTGYRSWAEVTAAMADPRYQRDPAYQQDVAAKLKVSNI